MFLPWYRSFKKSKILLINVFKFMLFGTAFKLRSVSFWIAIESFKFLWKIFVSMPINLNRNLPNQMFFLFIEGKRIKATGRRVHFADFHSVLLLLTFLAKNSSEKFNSFWKIIFKCDILVWVGLRWLSMKGGDNVKWGLSRH